MVAARQKLELVPKRLFYVRQIKHYLDIDKYPRWKVLFFYKVYLPFVRWVYHTLKLPVLMKIDAEGRPCWEERQAFTKTEEEAQEMIRGKRWWSYVPVSEGVCLPAETCVIGPCVDSGSHAGDTHVRQDWPIVGVHEQRLDEFERGLTEIERMLGT